MTNAAPNIECEQHHTGIVAWLSFKWGEYEIRDYSVKEGDHQ